MKARNILLFFIILGVIVGISIIITLLFIKRIANRKRLLLIILPVVLIIMLFFAFAYYPRSINKKYLKDNPLKIYCCYKDQDTKEYMIMQLNENFNDEFVKKTKKVSYIPTYNVMNYKISYAITDYFCIQYDEYYVIIGENLWMVNDGVFIEYKVFNTNYKLIQNKSGISEEMRFFDFDEWKNYFSN